MKVKQFVRVFTPLYIYLLVLVQAILFGIIHFNLYQGLGAIPFGIMSGYLYKKNKSLKLCIVLHMAHNLCVFVIRSYYP